MSRIGVKPVSLPEGVNVTIDGQTVKAEGPKGSLSLRIHEDMTVREEGGDLFVERPSDSKVHRMLHGTTRSHIQNLIDGVQKGFNKKLKMVGVGYRAQKQGDKLIINAGYSNPKEVDIPEGLEVEIERNNVISISGIDKHKVGEFAAHVRAVRKPEPYQGKGIRYVDEQVRRKEGKTAK